MACSHAKYTTEAKMVSVAVTSLNIKQLVLRVKVTCANCKRNFVFKGDTGFSTVQALASPSGFELRAPMDYPDEEGDDEVEGEEEPPEGH